MLTIRNLPDEVHCALRARASLHDRSIEAEVRAILRDAVLPEGSVSLGTLLNAVGQRAGFKEEEFAGFPYRDTSAALPVDLK